MAATRFDDDVLNVEEEIMSALWQRQLINVNKNTGVANLSPEDRDFINPCVTVTREEIKAIARREKLREVFVDKVRHRLESRDGITVEGDNDQFTVCMTPVRAQDNQFTSLKCLREKNQRELSDEPELGEAMW